MNIQNNDIVHVEKYCVTLSIGEDRMRCPWRSCCGVSEPCDVHRKAPMWMVGTACGVVVPVRNGAKEEGGVTCLACLASS